jgi:hypothetical protein
MLNKKALSIFLALTFGFTIILIVAARLMGFNLIGAPVINVYSRLKRYSCPKISIKKVFKGIGVQMGTMVYVSKDLCPDSFDVCD